MFNNNQLEELKLKYKNDDTVLELIGMVEDYPDVKESEDEFIRLKSIISEIRDLVD